MLVSILDGTLLLDERDCRTIERPDGGLAAIWRGQAFPLLPDGKSIDVSQEGWSPSELALLKPREAPPAYALLENKDSVYVLLSGSVTDREAAVSRLKLARIEVERTGPYLGAPVAGMDCDWYIRLSHPGRLDLSTLIANSLGVPPSQANAPGDLRTRLLETELSLARARNAADRAELARIRLENAALQSTSAEAQSFRMAMEAANAEAIRLTQEFERLSQEVARSREMQHIRPDHRIETEIVDMMAMLLPRARLLRDSLQLMTIEYASRKGVYRALQELHTSDQGIPSAWKVVKGLNGWWERHVSNGQADTGRAYARLDTSDRIWDVLLSHKATQPRDMQWLARN